MLLSMSNGFGVNEFLAASRKLLRKLIALNVNCEKCANTLWKLENVLLIYCYCTTAAALTQHHIFSAGKLRARPELMQNEVTRQHHHHHLHRSTLDGAGIKHTSKMKTKHVKGAQGMFQQINERKRKRKQTIYGVEK